MTAATGGSGHEGSYRGPGAIVTLRRIPAPGEVGCVGACPLCTSATRATPPCLACRDELRARLADLQIHYYMARAVN